MTLTILPFVHPEREKDNSTSSNAIQVLLYTDKANVFCVGSLSTDFKSDFIGYMFSF